MSTAQTLGLGAIAGFTIFLGLPIGRMPKADPRMRAALSSIATGILIFLLWDVLSHGVEPVEEALTDGRDARFAGLAALLALGVAGGMLVLVYYDRWIGGRRQSKLVGPGAAAVDEFRARGLASLTPGRRLAVLIATGIGIHNFAEGLAIGQSAAAGGLAPPPPPVLGLGGPHPTEGL